jgi:hypothetical protein
MKWNAHSGACLLAVLCVTSCAGRAPTSSDAGVTTTPDAGSGTLVAAPA